MYITDDGKTRLYVDLPYDGFTVPLIWYQRKRNAITLDWGDGSPVESFNDLNYAKF
jgi:hypothetical protein